MCLVQGHNAVTPVRLKPTTPWSSVKESTTEPLHSFSLLETQMLTMLEILTKN